MSTQNLFSEILHYKVMRFLDQLTNSDRSSVEVTFGLFDQEPQTPLQPRSCRSLALDNVTFVVYLSSLGQLSRWLGFSFFLFVRQYSWREDHDTMSTRKVCRTALKFCILEVSMGCLLGQFFFHNNHISPPNGLNHLATVFFFFLFVTDF